MAVVTYHVRLYHLKLYPLEALEVGIRAPFAKPRAALSTARAAADAVLHTKMSFSRETQPNVTPRCLTLPEYCTTHVYRHYPTIETYWTL
jgi:hypothetical protein